MNANIQVHNAELDHTESGGYAEIQLQDDGGYSFPPRILHKSPETVHALRGQDAVLECIFGGRYTSTCSNVFFIQFRNKRSDSNIPSQ